ncbi:MAG: glycosyltransferase [Oscillochloris sp.]|nr:glycosyltransferase [Oscillochloris sp.]
MARRVLILSASVGSGHISAAAAIEQALRTYPDMQVENRDALKLTSRIYQVTASDAYFALVKENPWLVGWWYDQNDEPFRNEVGALKLWNMLNAQPLADFILDYRPDITICTHFLPAGMVAQLLSEGEIATRLAIVTTDFDFQGMWLSRVFHRYFVAIEETKVHLAALGVDPERVTVSGIPVNRLFGEPVDRPAVLQHFGLRDELPVIMVSAGALGGGPAQQIVAQLLQLRTPAQVVVVCGRNQTLRQEVTKQVSGQAERFRVIGFTNEMPDLLRVATLFIGKPGGLTAAECLAAGLPMVVIEPIPGQEERNTDHLLENGAAIRCRSLNTLAYKVDRILSEPGRLDGLRAGTRRLGRPDAAAVVADTLLNDSSEPQSFSSNELKQIIAAARNNEVEIPEPPARRPEVALYHDDTGRYVGVITPDDLQFLIDQLEEEDDDDETYYVDPSTLDFLAERGARPTLLDVLWHAVADRSGTEIRYVRSA